MPRLRHPLEISLPDGWAGEVLDLSIAGLRVRSVARVQEGAELQVTLSGPRGEKVPLSVEVKWVNPPQIEGGLVEFGLSLLAVPQPYHQLLADLFADAPET